MLHPSVAEVEKSSSGTMGMKNVPRCRDTQTKHRCLQQPWLGTHKLPGREREVSSVGSSRSNRKLSSPRSQVCPRIPAYSAIIAAGGPVVADGQVLLLAQVLSLCTLSAKIQFRLWRRLVATGPARTRAWRFVIAGPLHTRNNCQPTRNRDHSRGCGNIE